MYRKEKENMKLFSKIATALVGMAMAIGVGVAVSGNNSKEVRAASTTLSSTFTSISWADSNSLWNSDKDGTATGDSRGISIQKAATGAGATTKTSYSNVSAASIWLSKSSNGVGSVTLKVGSTTVLTQSTFTSSSTEYAGSIGTALSGAISFSVTCTTSTIYVEKVQWTYDEGGVTYTITYDSNGGTGTMEDTTNTVAACTFTAPEGKTFSTWNTAANGSGTNYAPGATATSDLDLFAIWVDKPTAVTLDKIGTALPTTANTTLETVDIADGSDTYTLNYLQCKKQGDSMFMTKNVSPFISNHTEIPGAITSVEVFINSGASGSTTYDVAFGTSEYTTATAGIGAVNITGGNSHVFENEDVTDATYFCITLGNANNGQVLKIVVSYEASSEPKLLIQDTNHSTGPFEMVYNSSDSVYLTAWDEGAENPIKEGLTWTFSNNDVVNHVEDSYTWTELTPKGVGSVDVTVSHEGYKSATTKVTVTPGTLTGITVSGSMTKTSYYVGEAWSNAGLVATATYDSGYQVVVTDEATWTWNPASPAVTVTSVVATATIGEVSGSSSAQTVTVSKTNQIQALYTKESRASVDVYGYYVGYLTHTNKAGTITYYDIIIQDGEYGIMAYGVSTEPSYTVKETVLHVTGSISIYSGLYEIGSPSVSEASSIPEDKVPDNPVVYAAAGGETAEYASRMTTVTGTFVVASGSQGDFSSDAGTNDITLTFTVGSKTVQVFYKKAAQTADADTYAAMKDAVGSTEVTVKGFTSWHNGFQVQMNGYIPPAEDYTAEEFSQDLLDQTDAVCKDYDDVTNNHDAIEAIWSNLASNDKYPSLPADQKTILAEAARDESGTVVEQAMARYDYLTGKYNLSNFINGRTPVVFAAPSTISSDNNINSSMSIIVVAVIAITSLSAIGVLLVIKRRKSI